MAFPSSPANGQRATVNNIIYEYNDTKGAWLRVSAQGFTSANLTVGGIITDNYYRADGTSLLGVNKSVYNGTASATTSVSLVDSVPTAGNTSVSWSLTSKDSNNSTYKNSVVSSLNDGTNVYYSEYGIILSNASVSVSTFTSNIVSGNLRLYAVGDSANVTITFQRTLLGSSTDVGYITAGSRGAQGPEGNVNVSYGNTEVATYLTTYTGNIGNLKTTSNVITTGYFIGNGSQLTGIVTGSSYGNTEVATYLTTYTGNLSAGATTIGGNLTVSGNLIVNGNVTYINANNVNINDSLIYLADDNPADTLDIGFVSAFTDATRYQHTGIVRDATDGVWKLFANVVAEPNTTVDFTNANYSNLQIGNLIANSVGIGTTTPSAFCHTTGAGVGFKHTNGSITLQMYSDATNGVQTVNGPFFVQTTGANPFIINTNSVERVRVDSSGRVGIGTSNPSVELEIAGTTLTTSQKIKTTTAAAETTYENTAGKFTVGKENSNGTYFGVTPYASVLSSQGAYPLIFRVFSAEKMRIDSSGNVGIGNTAPLHTLSVSGNVFASGNISTTGYFLGNAALLTGLPSSYGNTEVASYLPTYTGAFGNLSSGITASGPIRTTGIIFANASIASTSTTTGALVVTGGVGIDGNLFVGGAVNNPTVTNYTESVVAIGTVTTASTLSLTNGTVQTATLTASTACTFTMPTATAGKSFVLLLKQAAATGNGTATFTGVKFNGVGAPTITAAAGKMDILSFISDGTNWYGSYTQGYTP